MNGIFESNELFPFKFSLIWLNQSKKNVNVVIKLRRFFKTAKKINKIFSLNL